MTELRMCGNTWAFCEGNCNDCRTIATASTQHAQDFTKSCTDTISRWGAINLIERMKPYQQDADDIAEMIHNMPSARPEWEELLVICDNCGHAIRVKRHQGDSNENQNN